MNWKEQIDLCLKDPNIKSIEVTKWYCSSCDL